MLELRILNGLHRGATLPLDAQAVHIGAGDAADVVLADHGIADDHAQLAPNGDGWLLSGSDGAIYMASHAEAQALVELAAGDCARVGDIWLSIDRQDAPWQAPPPMPAPEPHFDARTEAEEAPADAPGPDAAPAKPRGPWRRRGVGALLAAVAAMLAATAYALTSRTPLPVPAAPTAKSLDIDAPKRATSPKRAPAAATPQPGTDAAALAALFRKRLADAELLSRFDLTLEPNAWTMQAHLDDEESARFERILNSFIKEHNITFPVRAKAVTAEAMLPFRIGQVISGANAAVVTQDGARLYVGDDYRGVRLVAIQPSRVTFFGKRKIEVIW
jgi:type III secretion protein D